jgi:DNA-directed RNA polymerase subunit N (RpoN/RPB10)
MEEMKNKIICECGSKNVAQAVEIFENTTLPYKKAKKLVTGCNKTCCRRPLMALFNMVQFSKDDDSVDIDYEEIDFLIEQMNSR